MLCETIELKNGTRWKTLHRAGKQDLADGEMVVVCPRCHVAFVARDTVVKVTAPCLDREDVRTVDKRSLGGLNNHDYSEDDFESLAKIHQLVKANSEKRAKQLLGFFHDLNESLMAMYDKLRSDARACIVVGNRLMSRVRIPTHTIIGELSAVIGFEHDKTIPQMIPTKRMPWQNAPENVEGEKANTMHSENIIVFRKS